MALNTVLVTLAGISLAAELAVVTNPSIGNEFGVPKLESALSMSTSQTDSKLSVQFHSAKVSEVLAWLQSHGFNFVVNDGDIANSKTVTLNISNQSVGSVADAVANALGGHWERSNGIHVYKRGTSSMNWMKVPTEGSVIWGNTTPNISQLPDKDVEKLFGPDFDKKIQNQFGPDFQKKMQNQFGPDFQKKMQDQFGPEFQKKMQNQFGPDFQKKMQDQFGPEFQKKMQNQFGPEFQKKMQDQFGPDFQKNFHGKLDKDQERKLEDQFGPKFQKQMEEQFGPKFQKQMEDQFGPKFQKQMEEMGERIQKEMEKNKSQGKDWSNNLKNRTDTFIQVNPGRSKKNEFSHTSSLGHFDANRFLNSLSPSEKDEQRKQGYVWYNDLSREQKTMFDQFDGKFDIDLKVNGEEIRVRRN